jgi:sugar lactone lactonase YvrE
MARPHLCLASLILASATTPGSSQEVVERIATGFGFVGGLVWDPASRPLRFSDIPNSRILELGPDATHPPNANRAHP